MSVTYLGHCAFVFDDTSGQRVLIDPFGNPEGLDWFLESFPQMAVDLVAVTHDHFDHNSVSSLAAGTPVMAEPGQQQIGQTTITGIGDVHSGSSGRAGMANVIFLIEHEGVRFCHLGDNRHDIPENVVQQIGKVDVLLVPVDDSCHLLSYDQVNMLVETFSPRVVIPMHYYSEGLTTVESTLEGPGGWVRTQSPRRTMRSARMRIDRRGLPYEREVWTIPPELAS